MCNGVVVYDYGLAPAVEDMACSYQTASTRPIKIGKSSGIFADESHCPFWRWCCCCFALLFGTSLRSWIYLSYTQCTCQSVKSTIRWYFMANSSNHDSALDEFIVKSQQHMAIIALLRLLRLIRTNLALTNGIAEPTSTMEDVVKRLEHINLTADIFLYD